MTLISRGIYCTVELSKVLALAQPTISIKIES